MIKFLLLIVLISISYNVFSQNNWTDFSGKQKAFFYQLTRKIETLEPEVFHLFEFTDSIPYVNDTLPDFPYVEAEIENDSSKLICHHTEFARKNRGLLMDIGTHYGTWELGLILQFKNSEKPQFQYLKPLLVKFEKLVLENVPSASAKMWTDGSYTLSPKIASYYSPNLNITEKIAALKNSSYNDDEKLTLLNAIYEAQGQYITKRAIEIVTILTGENITSKNYLLAAGDGKNWNDLESVIRTKYNRPLPDPKAFFAYDLESKRIGDTDERILGVKQNSVLKMNTNAQKNTNLHVDVWGYHPERQTTLIVQKGGNSYVLYGNNDNRYLSPDSAFGDGSTYASLIDELENVWIADLKERIYGKRGFDYLIALYEKKIVKTRLNIKKTEEKLDKLRYKPEGPPKMKKKKKSRKQRKKGQSVSYQDNQGTPRGQLSGNAKKKQIEQFNLVGYEGQLQTELSTLKQLKIDKEEAFDLLARYEAKLDVMKKSYGYNLMTFSKDKNGFYTFIDGTIFNSKTQDLTFMPNGEGDYFEVILVSFGKNVMDKNYEEVFVHLNLNNTNKTEVYTLRHKSKTPHKMTNYTATDSIQIQEFFTALAEKSKSIVLNAETNFVSTQTDSVFRNIVESLVQVDASITIQLFAEHNQFQPKNPNASLTKMQGKNSGIALNKLAAAADAKQYLEAWKIALAGHAESWITDAKTKKTVLKRLKKIKMSSVLVDGKAIKV